MVGIDKTLEVINDIGDFAVAAIAIVKSGVGFGSLPKLIDMARAVNECIKDVPAALPELKDIDPKESGVLAEKSYEMVLKIIIAVKG